jgi:hypothetical protein
MTKQRAIYLKCLDCAAGDRKEVLFCMIFDCPLWEYRCGCHISSCRYRDRVQRAFKTFREIVAELQQEGLDMADFLPLRPQACISAGKGGEKAKDAENGALQGKGVL